MCMCVCMYVGTYPIWNIHANVYSFSDLSTREIPSTRCSPREILSIAREIQSLGFLANKRNPNPSISCQEESQPVEFPPRDWHPNQQISQNAHAHLHVCWVLSNILAIVFACLAFSPREEIPSSRFITKRNPKHRISRQEKSQLWSSGLPTKRNPKQRMSRQGKSQVAHPLPGEIPTGRFLASRNLSF